MNAYEIDIWRGVKHNGKFVVNNSRKVLVHARNENEAKSKVTLALSKTYNYSDVGKGKITLIIEVSQETVYSCIRIGTVKIERFYTYSNGRTPTLVSDFKGVKRGH